MTIYEKQKILQKELKNQILDNIGLEEMKRYYKEFKNQLDYNIAQYGNLLIYYTEVRDFYKDLNFTDYLNYSDEKIWEQYKKDIGIVVRKMIGGDL